MPRSGSSLTQPRQAAAGTAAAGTDIGASTQIRDQLRSRGLRWTPQRRLLLDVLRATDGHVTGSELVDRCRAIDSATTPSTVYRTLRVLEDLGVVRHAHGRDGREEFHVRPSSDHGHLHCEGCGASWEIAADDAVATIDSFRERRGFAVNLSHLTVVGRCAACQSRDDA
jgi:Fur family ferric uptake transcriptional regulator